jgi:hypothetical protein
VTVKAQQPGASPGSLQRERGLPRSEAMRRDRAIALRAGARAPAAGRNPTAAPMNPSRMPRAGFPGSVTRPVSEQDIVREGTHTGELKPLGELMPRAQAVGRGEYLGVEHDISSNIYRFKFMRSSGNVVWVDMDGRSGKVVAELP